jgi:hypothetical protein
MSSFLFFSPCNHSRSLFMLSRSSTNTLKKHLAQLCNADKKKLKDT